MTKLKADFLGEYTTVINGQEVKVKKYGPPRLDIDDEERKQLEKLFDLVPEN
jgi:hypothetical protein